MPVVEFEVPAFGVRGIGGRLADAAPGERAAVIGSLGPVDRRRLADASDSRADRMVLGRLLLARLVGAHELAHGCPRCGSDEHGRPRLVGDKRPVSIAYAGDAAVVVVGPGGALVGVDAEPVGRIPPDGVDLAGWTRIEAVLKADGRGLAVEPDSVVVAGGVAAVPGRGAPVRVVDVDAVAGLVVAVAAVAG